MLDSRFPLLFSPGEVDGLSGESNDRPRRFTRGCVRDRNLSPGERYESVTASSPAGCSAMVVTVGIRMMGRVGYHPILDRSAQL